MRQATLIIAITKIVTPIHLCQEKNLSFWGESDRSTMYRPNNQFATMHTNTSQCRPIATALYLERSLVIYNSVPLVCSVRKSPFRYCQLALIFQTFNADKDADLFADGAGYLGHAEIGALQGTLGNRTAEFPFIDRMDYAFE